METTPERSPNTFTFPAPPPILKKNRNPDIIVRGNILGTIRRQDSEMIMELDRTFLVKNENISIDNADKLHSVEHLDQFMACVNYSFNRVTNEVKIINPYDVSKIFIKHIDENNIRYIVENDMRRPIKRKLDMDIAIDQDEIKKSKEQ